MIIGIVALATAAVAGAAGGPVKKIDRDSAAGPSPVVFVTGDHGRPRQFILEIESNPSARPFNGSASISCRDKAYHFADRTRAVTVMTPAKIKVAPTKRRPAYCSVAVSGGAVFSPDDYGTGRLTATLFVKTRH